MRLLFSGLLTIGASLATQAVPAQQPAKPAAEPDPVEQHFQAAQTYQLTGDLDRAAEEYRRTISIGLQRLGNLRLAQRNYEDAGKLLADSSATDPKNTDAVLDLAVVQFYKGELAQAKSSLAPILAANPSDFRALNIMGKVEFLEGNFQAAADHLQAALAVKPDFDVAYSLALANLQLKKLPQATVLFDEMKASMKPSPELLMLIGRAYRETGYTDEAIREFQKALALDPKYLHAHFALGLAYLRGGEKSFAQAEKEFATELAMYPQDELSRYYLGVVQFQRHQLADAAATLERSVRQRSDRAEAHFYLGQVYLQQGRLDLAASALRKAISLMKPGASDAGVLTQAHGFLSDVLTKQGHTEEAKRESALADELRAAKSSEPSDHAVSTAPSGISSNGPGSQELRSLMTSAPPQRSSEQPRETAYEKSVARALGEAYHNLGVIEARKSQYASAAADFSQASRWNPDIAALDRNWGLAAFRAEQYEQAVAPLQRQLKRAPEDSSVRQMLGLSLYMTDQFSASADVFRPILNDLPDNPGLLYAAGVALVRSGDSASGSRLFERMLEHGSNVPEVHLMLGEAYSSQSQYPEALKEYERALQINPRMQEVHYYAGMAYFKQGKLEEAITELNSELALNARFIPAMYQLAYIRLQQHQPDNAIELLEDIVAQKPNYGDAHYQLGKALLEKDKVETAIQHLETSTQLQPEQSYGFYQLSLAYRRAGRTHDAEKALSVYQALKEKEAKQTPRNAKTM